MDDRSISAYLRAATKAKILHGWYWHEAYGPRTWIITPAIGPAREIDGSEYAEALASHGIEPLYVS